MYAGDIVEVGTCDEIFFSPKHPYQLWRLYSSLFYSTRGTVSGNKAAVA
jgi:ABC-type dipeptide/oligopeptide/nickel transport system ATPase component